MPSFAQKILFYAAAPSLLLLAFSAGVTAQEVPADAGQDLADVSRADKKTAAGKEAEDSKGSDAKAASTASVEA